MPECVVDTSCLIVLDKLELLAILCQLYDRVYVPKGVAKEFGHIPSLRCMCEVSVNSELVSVFTEDLNMGLGEAETIVYAYEHGMKAIIDDEMGRKLAAKLGIRLTGTIGLLMKAEDKGIIESALRTVLDLKKMGFYVSDGIIEELKKREIRRKELGLSAED